ncbi:unnamed protein product, partial [Amoebophrya sp. A120]
RSVIRFIAPFGFAVNVKLFGCGVLVVSGFLLRGNSLHHALVEIPYIKLSLLFTFTMCVLLGCHPATTKSSSSLGQFFLFFVFHQRIYRFAHISPTMWEL